MIPMMLPKLTGMRVYFSLGSGLFVNANSQQGAARSAPCGWCGAAGTEKATNFNTIFEFAEFTWVDKNGGIRTRVEFGRQCERGRSVRPAAVLLAQRLGHCRGG